MNDKVSVLVIDDSPIIPKLVSKALAGSIYEVTGYAENGLVGIEMYGNIKPDMVLIDLTMPELDGVETVKGILKIDPEAKIIILSATDYSDIKEELGEMGVNLFISKPFKPDELLDIANKLMQV